MDALKSTTSSLFQNKKVIIIIALCFLLIIIAIYYYYKKIAPSMNPSFVPNKEFVQKGDGTGGNEAEIILFYTEWCPHCKKAKPIWAKLKDKYDGKAINNTIIHFREVDCDKDEATATKYNIEGYPTIKLVKGSQIIEYDAKPEENTLEEFLNTTL